MADAQGRERSRAWRGRVGIALAAIGAAALALDPLAHEITVINLTPRSLSTVHVRLGPHVSSEASIETAQLASLRFHALSEGGYRLSFTDDRGRSHEGECGYSSGFGGAYVVVLSEDALGGVRCACAPERRSAPMKACSLRVRSERGEEAR